MFTAEHTESSEIFGRCASACRWRMPSTTRRSPRSTQSPQRFLGGVPPCADGVCLRPPEDHHGAHRVHRDFWEVRLRVPYAFDHQKITTEHTESSEIFGRCASVCRWRMPSTIAVEAISHRLKPAAGRSKPVETGYNPGIDHLRAYALSPIETGACYRRNPFKRVPNLGQIV